MGAARGGDPSRGGGRCTSIGDPGRGSGLPEMKLTGAVGTSQDADTASSPFPGPAGIPCPCPRPLNRALEPKYPRVSWDWDPSWRREVGMRNGDVHARTVTAVHTHAPARSHVEVDPEVRPCVSACVTAPPAGTVVSPSGRRGRRIGGGTRLSGPLRCNIPSPHQGLAFPLRSPTQFTVPSL